MARPIGSYFSWGRKSRSRTTTPTPADDGNNSSPRLTQEALPPLPRQQKALSIINTTSTTTTSSSSSTEPPLPQHLRAWRTESQLGGPPAASSQGLDDMQQCFRIEDSLRRTNNRLDTCSLQLDEMQVSAGSIRRDLEKLQRALVVMSSHRPKGAGVKLEAVETLQNDVAALEAPPTRDVERVEPALLPSTVLTRQLVERPALRPSQAHEAEPQDLPDEELAPLSGHLEALPAETTSCTTAPSPLSQETLVDIPAVRQVPTKIAELKISPANATHFELRESQPIPEPLQNALLSSGTEDEALFSPTSEPNLLTQSPEPIIQDSDSNSILWDTVFALRTTTSINQEQQQTPQSQPTTLVEEIAPAESTAQPASEEKTSEPVPPASQSLPTAVVDERPAPQPTTPAVSEDKALTSETEPPTPRSLATEQIERCPSPQAVTPAVVEKKSTPAPEPTKPQPLAPTKAQPPPALTPTQDPTPEEKAYQRTPRSMRSTNNTVMSRFPLSQRKPATDNTQQQKPAARPLVQRRFAAGPPPPAGSAAMPVRASLRPVVGSNKVSQMAHFWSQMDG